MRSMRNAEVERGIGHPTHAYVLVVLNGDATPDLYVASMPEFSKVDAEAFRDGWNLLRGTCPS